MEGPKRTESFKEEICNSFTYDKGGFMSIIFKKEALIKIRGERVFDLRTMVGMKRKVRKRRESRWSVGMGVEKFRGISRNE